MLAARSEGIRKARRNPINESLSTLTIGSLTLTPAFDPDVFDYTVTTSNATNKVTATASDPAAEVVIKVNDTEIDSGDTVTWESGENEVVITVTGETTNTYTVTVTAE